MSSLHVGTLPFPQAELPASPCRTLLCCDAVSVALAVDHPSAHTSGSCISWMPSWGERHACRHDLACQVPQTGSPRVMASQVLWTEKSGSWDCCL